MIRSFVPGGLWLITDEQGLPVSHDKAHELLEILMKSYPMPTPGHVYFALQYEREQPIYKIGITGQSLLTRMQQIRSDENGADIILRHAIPCKTMDDARLLEKWLHTRFGFRRVRGEWFRLFSYDLEWICSLTTPPIDLGSDPLFPIGSRECEYLMTYHHLALVQDDLEALKSIGKLFALTLDEVHHLEFYGDLYDLLSEVCVFMRGLTPNDVSAIAAIFSIISSKADIGWLGQKHIAEIISI